MRFSHLIFFAAALCLTTVRPSHAEDTVSGCLAVVKSVVQGLSLNRERAARAASGQLLATDVADYLVGKGVPFRRAHEIVGGLVRKLAAESRSQWLDILRRQRQPDESGEQFDDFWADGGGARAGLQVSHGILPDTWCTRA